MAKQKKRELTKYEKRRIRKQQIIIAAIGIIIILSMVISLMINV